MKLSEAKLPCTCCGIVSQQPGWFLSGYHGISGYYCSNCYVKVAHDSYGNPVNPKEYMFMLLKQKAQYV